MAVTKAGLVLDARQANPSIEGSMANKFDKSISDLKKNAFSGNYNDLTNKPTIPAVVRVKGNAESAYRTGDVNLTPANIGAAAASHEHDEFLKYLGSRADTLNFKGPFKIKHVNGAYSSVDGNYDIIYLFTDEDKAHIQYSCYNNDFFDLSPRLIGNSRGLGPGYLGKERKWTEIRGDNIYNSSGVITSSDRNQKKDFKQITPEFADAIIDGLIPTSFLYKDGTSGRRHYALIAQDVEKLLESLGIDSKDFAPLVKDYPTKEVKSENEDEPSKIVPDYDTEPEYSLRYEGFIGIIIKYIQGLKSQINDMQSKYDLLEKRIAVLESKNS